MCGIYGGLALTRPLQEESTRALRALAHRGPDGEGVAAIGNAVLAHTRLRIIDLSCAADQPLWDVRHRAAIVFNGEIYNYRELREECSRAGMEFASASDTEVIVNQFLLHGTKAFDRLNGMFAFCLYDASDGSGYLVRDRFGIKPLYYAPAAGGVLFASELKPLLESGGVDGTIDRAALQAYLQLDLVPTPYSIVRGVRKLDGGSWLRVAGDGVITTGRYTEARAVPDARDRRELLEELGRRIDTAVARHLIADVPAGVFLSGGIDSTIVAESAARITGRPVATFSIAFENRSFDESEFFNQVARAVGSEHHVRALSTRAMLELVPDIARRMDEPLADGSIYPTTLLARFAREQVTVALSGDGADELFAGYPTYFAHGAVRRMPGPAIRALRSVRGAAHRLLPVRFENLSGDYKVKKFLDGLDADMITRHVRWMGTFGDDDLRTLLVDYDEGAQRELNELLLTPARETDDGWLEQLLRTDQRFYMQDGVLVKVDRASMAASLEVRVPFLDREVSDFADAIPSRAKLRGTTTKALLRDYVATRFPPSISRRPKKGFGAPLARWFSGELRPLLEERLAPERLAARGIFQAKAVARLLDDHWSGRRDNRKQIFNLLTFVTWQDQFGESNARTDET